jgi:hypothetical protein
MGHYRHWHDSSRGHVKDVQELAKEQQQHVEAAKNGWGSGMLKGNGHAERHLYVFDNKLDQCGGLSMFTGPVYMFFSPLFQMWAVGPVAKQAPFYLTANIRAAWEAHDNVGNKFVPPWLPPNWLVSTAATGPIKLDIRSSCFFAPTPPPTPAPSTSPTHAPTPNKKVAGLSKEDLWRKRHAAHNESSAGAANEHPHGRGFKRIALPTPAVTDPPSPAPTHTPTKVPPGGEERVQVLSEASIDGAAGYTAQSFGQKERAIFCRCDNLKGRGECHSSVVECGSCDLTRSL